MARREPKKVREQVVVYLDARDRAMLEAVVKSTGLSRTELFRRGLRQIAGQALRAHPPGSAFDYLIATARDGSFPADVSERHDYYLEGGYELLTAASKAKAKRKRARSR